MKKQSLLEHVKMKAEVKQIIIIWNGRNLDGIAVRHDDNLIGLNLSPITNDFKGKCISVLSKSE